MHCLALPWNIHEHQLVIVNASYFSVFLGHGVIQYTHQIYVYNPYNI